MFHSFASLLKSAGVYSLLLAGCAAGTTISADRMMEVSFDELINDPTSYDGLNVVVLARPAFNQHGQRPLYRDAAWRDVMICVRSIDLTADPPSDRIDIRNNPKYVMASGKFRATLESEPTLPPPVIVRLESGVEAVMVTSGGPCRSRFSLYDVILRVQPD